MPHLQQCNDRGKAPGSLDVSRARALNRNQRSQNSGQQQKRGLHMRLIRVATRVSALAALLGFGLAAHAQSSTTLGIPADDSAVTPEDPDGIISRGLSIKSQARQMADA